MKNITAKILGSDNEPWNGAMAHETYDAYRKAHSIYPHLRDIKPAILTVGGWYDAEDLFEKPEPFIPGRVTKVEFELPDIQHAFLTGHRIMVQVQSTWFPLFDRNPPDVLRHSEGRRDGFPKGGTPTLSYAPISVGNHVQGCGEAYSCRSQRAELR